MNIIRALETRPWEIIKEEIILHIKEQQANDRDFAFHYLNADDYAFHWEQAKITEFGVQMKHITHGWDSKGYYYFLKWEIPKVEEVKEGKEEGEPIGKFVNSKDLCCICHNIPCDCQ